MVGRASVSNVSERDRKLCEVAISILEGAPSERLNVVVLNKALFYTDLVALRDFGHTLSGAEYLALKMGPVVAGYEKRLIRALDTLGWAEQLTGAGMAKPIRKVASPVEFKFLNESERHLARRAGDAFGGLTSTWVSSHSHDNPGWKTAWSLSAERNGAGTPINMVLALQQIDEDDEWLACDLTAEEREVIDSKSPPAEL